MPQDTPASAEPAESSNAPRRRAPGMSVEQRRAMIVSAALPLVAEHGAAITTSQIARAAGIGEATIFRAFKDKDEVLDACVAEAVSTEHVLREFASIPLDDPLPERLVQAADAMRAYMERMGSVLGSLFATRRRSRSELRQPSPDRRDESVQMLREGLAELLEPDRAVLRVAPEDVASVFLGMVFMQRRDGGDPAQPDPAGVVDLLLYGAVHPTAAARPPATAGPAAPDAESSAPGDAI